jgi:hypothetical protein
MMLLHWLLCSFCRVSSIMYCGLLWLLFKHAVLCKHTIAVVTASSNLCL